MVIMARLRELLRFMADMPRRHEGPETDLGQFPKTPNSGIEAYNLFNWLRCRIEVG
jgi:hypothetical protein